MIILLYGAMFATAALLALSPGLYPRVWLVLAALAVLALPLTAMGGFLSRPWASVGFVLILVFAAVRIAASRSEVT